MSKPVPLCSHVMIHRNGKTCGIPASRGSKYCYRHDPSARERKPLRAASARVPPFDSIPNLQRELADIMSLILQGKLDHRRADRMLRSIELAMRAHEQARPPLIAPRRSVLAANPSPGVAPVPRHLLAAHAQRALALLPDADLDGLESITEDLLTLLS